MGAGSGRPAAEHEPETPGDEWIAVGRLTAVHGVRGWLKAESWTVPRHQLAVYRNWWLGDERLPVVCVAARGDGGRLQVRLAGIEDRDRAAPLVGRAIYITRSMLPPAEEGRYYWADLEGLEVVDLAGRVLGRVASLLATGANDVLVVRGERERLIPFIPQVVRAVDLPAGTIRVDWEADV
mgnify:CR=1 FL=1